MARVFFQTNSADVTSMSENGKSQLLPAAVLAAGIVVAASIASWAFVHVKTSDQTIVVTGSARRRIKSDMILWSAEVTATAPKLAQAYQSLSRDVSRVRSYLVSKGIPDDQIITSSITTKTVRRAGKKASDESDSESGAELTGNIIGYSLQQEVQVRSADVDKITKISREVTELVNQGILLDSNAPQYIYTKLGDLKIEMLSEAARDAKIRAQQIASSTGNRVGSLRAAEMGVMQITPPDSNEVSGSGENDTTSLDKDITAVVHMTFAID
jgi:hypothetical protein